MTDWKEFKLSEIGTLARGKSKHRPRDASHLYGGKYPFVQTGDIKAANHKLYNFTQTYSEEGLKQSKLWPNGTICITIAANIADTAILTFPACFPDSVIGFIPDKEKCDGDFVEYLLQYYRLQIKTHSIGSVQDNINLGTFEKIKFKFPPLPTQSAIAEILSSLDDKIELNNQINQNLEALAQALFKQWFVDFEFPNENGEPYKSSGGEMVDSELGEIPKGWEICTIGDITKTVTKGTTPTTIGGRFTEEGINFIKVESISESGTFIKSKFGFIDDETHELLKRSKIQDGDVLFSIAGTIGRVAIATKSILPANTNQAVAIIRPEKINRNFLRLLMKSSLIQSDTKSNIVQAVQANLSLGVIKATKFILPDQNTLNEFDLASGSLFQMIEELSGETENLIQLRDTLLPKLISGELEVKEAMEQIS